MIAFVEGKPGKNVMDLIKNGKIILINAKEIISPLEVESAYIKAKRSFINGNNTSRDLGSEIMVYLFGSRQISEAIKTYGMDEHSERYFLISDENINVENLGFKISKFQEREKKEKIMQRLEKIALVEIKK